jgi:hypothetical protein
MNLRGELNIAPASLTASTTYNLLCGESPAHQQIAITGFGYYGSASAAGASGLLQFATAANQGSSGTTITPGLLSGLAVTFQSSWISTPSTAPGTIVPYASRYVNPQTGLFEFWGSNDWFLMAPSTFWILQFTPGASGTYGGWLRIAE